MAYVEWIDIGEGHEYYLMYWQTNDERRGQLWGIRERHRKDDGSWCLSEGGGAIHFNRESGINSGWDLVTLEPLTITPSLQCLNCPSHGFITDGKWKEC